MQSPMRSVGAVGAALLVAMPGFGIGCGSADGPVAAPSASADTSKPDAAAPAAAAAVSAAAPVPSAGKTDSGIGPATSQPGNASAGIQASTKRSAAGLPEPLPDYLSWTPVSYPHVRTSNEMGQLPHSIDHRAYVSFPKAEPAKAPYPPGTIFLIEEKAEGKDFIDRIGALVKAEDGWKYSAYARQQATATFAAASSAVTAQCAACHAKGEDSVFSRVSP